MNRALMAAVLVVAVASAPAAQISSQMIDIVDRGVSGLTVTTEFPTAQQILQSEDPGEFSVVYDNQDRSIPAVIKWIAVPEGCVPELTVTERNSHAFNGSDVSPQQLSPGDLAGQSVWPPEPASIGRVEVVRGIPIAPLTIYKLQLGEGETGVENDQIALDIRFVRSLEAPPVQEFHEKPFTRSAQFVRSVLLNSPFRDPAFPPPLNGASELSEDQQPYIDHILMLYSSTLNQQLGVPWVDSLANWKRQMGYKVTVRAINLAQVTALEIRQMIRNEYYFGVEDPIAHLIIIGTDSSNQATTFPTCPGPENRQGDHGYSLMDVQRGEHDVGLVGEMVSDITVGRFDVTNYASLQGAIKRTIYYERIPYTEGGVSWFNHGLYTAENIMADGGQFVPSMVQLGKWIARKLGEDGYNPVETLYTGSNPDSIDVVNRRVRTLVENEGISVAISRGWLYGAADVLTQWTANTGRRNPFVMAITCLSRETQRLFFGDNHGASLSGPVASFAIWGLTHSRTNNGLMGGMVRSMRYFDQSQPGFIMNFSKWQLWSDYQFDNTVDYEKMELLYYFRLMGDPTVDVFNAYPDTLRAVHVESLTSGATGFSVAVNAGGEPVENAAVCVMHPNGIHWVAVSGADGIAHFNFDPDQLTAGNLLLTVTAHNAIPYIRNIPVQDAGQGPAAVLTNVAYQDQDGLYSNGEEVGITLTFRNNGNAALNNGSIVLSTNQPDWITFLPNDTVAFDGSIAANGGTRDVSFRAAINRSTPFETHVQIRANVISGNLRWPNAFEFTTSAPDLFLASVGLLADNQFGRDRATRFAPLLRNGGNRPSVALNGTLVCLEDDLVEITDNSASFAASGVGEDARITGDFTIRTSGSLVPGTTLHFSIQLAAVDQGDGYRDVVDFTVEAGVKSETDPSGPDQYGYYCFDNFDESWRKRPAYAWREINPARRGEFNGTQLDLPDYRMDLDANAVLRLPFTFQYYGQDFDSLVVNSNGWIAFGAVEAQFLDFRNWPIPGVQGPDAMVAGYWDDLYIRIRDGNGVFYHYVEDENIFIIEWSGLEIVRDAAGGRQEFQIILYDPASWTTRTGDGDIKCQYKQINPATGDPTDNFFATLGIKNLDGSDGITYNYWNTAFPGARLIEGSMAILYTTGLDLLTGSASGTVTRFENGAAVLEGVRVSTSTGQTTVTDANGAFHIDDLAIGQVSFLFEKPGFNNARVVATIEEGREARFSVGLHHPEIVPPQASLTQELQPGVYFNEQTIPVGNRGNGPLDFRLTVRDRDGNNPSFENILSINGRDIDRAAVNSLRGVEFIGDKLYVSVGGTIAVGDNWIVVLNRQGVELRRFRQNSLTQFGFADLAWDGQYIYGGEDDSVTVLDTLGNLIRRIHIPFGQDPPLGLPFVTALAYYPPNNSLLMASTGTPIFQMSLEGEPLDQIPIGFPDFEEDMSGLAYNPGDNDGMPIYAIMKTNIGDSRRMWLTKTNIAEARIVRQLAQYQLEDATGLAIGFEWESGKTILATIANRNNSIDTLRLYDLGPDTRCIWFDRGWQSVQPNAPVDFPVLFRSSGIALGSYEFSLVLFHNALSDSVRIPVRFVVSNETGTEGNGSGAPSYFNLEEAYPNPFNSSTLIAFTLPRPMKARLAIYDLAGREVEQLWQGETAAGRQTMILKADNYPAGLYFARLDGEEGSIIRRLVILK